MRDPIWHDLGPAFEAEDGTLREVILDAEAVLLVRLEGEWLAVAGDCTHDECPLVDGEVVAGAIHCMCHGAAFDLRTGEVIQPPATERLRVYELRTENGRLLVSLESAD
jgi:nitrite reductase/ring-hydroxylating ferredoxin subunit